MSALRVAHRGDARRAPENTLAALLAALDVPACDGVEFDVRFARDGTPVLQHDATLRRVHGRDDAVSTRTAAELAEVGVSTLAEVMAAMPRKAFLDIELKEPPRKAFYEIVEGARGADLDDAVVSSFDPEAIGAVHRARPTWRCWLNASDLSPETIAQAADAGCIAISAEWPAIDEDGMERAAAAGLAVAAWTVLDVATFERFSALGVIAVCVEADALDG